jgi:hypothetical protein
VNTCVFAGPTLYRELWPAGIRRFGPAAMGSVFRAVEAGFRRVGIVDGLFGNAPSVWHKEILYAISAGVEIVGAGSMGALRAAELSGFGMIGIGRIFRLFRSGLWSDDDEVAIIHASEELDYFPLSETMANVRFTLRRLRRSGYIDRLVATELVRSMKARHFSQRTRDALREDATLFVGRDAAARFTDEFERRYVDVKRLDAQMLLAYLSQPNGTAQPPQARAFPATGHWREQFKTSLADVPPLR